MSTRADAARPTVKMARRKSIFGNSVGGNPLINPIEGDDMQTMKEQHEFSAISQNALMLEEAMVNFEDNARKGILH